MKLENYQKFRKIIELIEIYDAKILDIKNYSDFRDFLYSQIHKFVHKLNFHKIYKKYDTIDFPDINLKYYLFDVNKNKVIKKKDYFYVYITYEVDYDEHEVYDINWEIDGEPILVTGDILLGFEMKCKINNYKNKYFFVLEDKMVVNKSTIKLRYIQ